MKFSVTMACAADSDFQIYCLSFGIDISGYFYTFVKLSILEKEGQNSNQLNSHVVECRSIKKNCFDILVMPYLIS